MNILNYIKHNYPNFTHSEKSISDFLLNCNDGIINFSAKDIAKKTGTSPATVIRFSQKIGFKSLTEMKLKLSLSLEENNRESKFQYLDDDLSTNSIIQSIKLSFDDVMEKTVKTIDEQSLTKAIDLLSQSSRIFIFGVGCSGLVAQDFYHKLIRIGKYCTAPTDTHLQITSSVMMKKDDVVIAISYSGTTREILECVKNAQTSNTPVICVTKAGLSNPLTDLSDITLNVPFVEKILREGAMSSRISQLAVMDMLFIGMARNDAKEVEQRLINTRKAVEKLKF